MGATYSICPRFFVLVVISCNSRLQRGKGNQYRRGGDSAVHHHSDKHISIVLHWSFTGRSHPGKKKKGGGNVTSEKTLPNEFSSWAEPSQVNLLRKKEWDGALSTLRACTSSYSEKRPRIPYDLPTWEISTKPGERNLCEPGQQHWSMQQDWKQAVGLPYYLLWGGGDAWGHGVAECLSPRSAAQCKAMSHRRASVASRNAAAASNTLWATLPSPDHPRQR